MRSCWWVVFLVLGAVCFALFWITDLAGAALGRHLLLGMLEGSFEGDCPKEDHSSGRFVRSLPYPFNYIGLNFTISERLNGLRLGVRVNPFRLEDKGGKLTYVEEGVWALQVEVADKTIWVMQDPEHSTMTVRQPFYNVNLLTALLAPMVMDAMPESNFPVDVPVPPVSFENKSIIDRVQTAWNVTDAIKKAFNVIDKTNSLQEIHGFLSLGGDAALAYRNSLVNLGKRQISPKSAALWSMEPLLPKRSYAYIPGLKNVTFEYWRSGESGVTGLSVDKYRAKDIWEPNILCQLTSKALLNMYEKLRKYSVYMTSPGKTQSENFSITSSVPPYAVILEVYRPFATPMGETVAVQMNYLIPYNASVDKLQGELTPVTRVEVEVEELPDEVIGWIVTGIRVRSALLILLLIFSCLFLVAAFMCFVFRRNPRRNRTLILFHRMPL